MQRYNEVLPGAAERIFAMWEQETSHRRRIEIDAQLANISAIQKQQEFAERQAQLSYSKNLLGQILGFLAFIVCIAGTVYAARTGSDWRTVAAIVSVPSIGMAAIIYAFLGKSFSRKPQATKDEMN